jgi:GTP-binding protein LepA
MLRKAQAQTISNLYLALENDLEIIPVLNKVDLPSANPEEVSDDIVDLQCKLDEIIHASGKTGFGVENILAAIIERIPPPKGIDEPLQALILTRTTIRFVESKLFSELKRTDKRQN